MTKWKPSTNKTINYVVDITIDDKIVMVPKTTKYPEYVLQNFSQGSIYEIRITATSLSGKVERKKGKVHTLIHREGKPHFTSISYIAYVF